MCYPSLIGQSRPLLLLLLLLAVAAGTEAALHLEAVRSQYSEIVVRSDGRLLCDFGTLLQVQGTEATLSVHHDADFDPLRWMVRIVPPSSSRGQLVIKLLNTDCQEEGGDETGTQLAHIDTDTMPALWRRLPPVKTTSRAWVVTVTPDRLTQPWWLCADLVHIAEVLDQLETVSYTTPFTSQYGYPSQPARPARHLVRRVHHAVSSSSRSQLDIHEIRVTWDSRVRALVVAMLNQQPPTPVHIEISNINTTDSSDQIKLTYVDNDPNADSNVVFIVAVGGRDDRLRHILRLHRANALQGDRFGLCLIDYVDVNKTPLDSFDHFQQLMTLVKMHHVQITGPFNKVDGLQQCLQVLAPDDIAFVLDIDLDFEQGLADTVRHNVIKGRRFFAPIVHYDDHDGQGQLYTDSPMGWATGGTGIVGVFVSDARRVGGYNTDLFGNAHGWEDSDFFFRLRASGLEVSRFRINKLVHLAHRRKGTWADQSSIRHEVSAFGCLNRSEYLRGHFVNVVDRLVTLGGNVTLPKNKDWLSSAVIGSNLYYKLHGAREKWLHGRIRRAQYNADRGGLSLLVDSVMSRSANGASRNEQLWLPMSAQVLSEVHIIPTLIAATVETSWQPLVGHWWEYALSADASGFAMSAGPIESDTNFTIVMREPYAAHPSAAAVVVASTGNALHPLAILERGFLRVATCDSNGHTETFTAEFIRGSARVHVQSSAAILSIEIASSASQQHQLVIHSIRIL